MIMAPMKNTIDIRGLTCPMTFVKAKLAIEMLDSGDELEVILDYPPAVHSIGRAMRELGHIVVEEAQLPDSAWRIVVRKG